MRRRSLRLAALGLVLALAGANLARAQIIQGTVYESTAAAKDALANASTTDATKSATFTVSNTLGIDYAYPPGTNTIGSFLQTADANFGNKTGGFAASDVLTTSSGTMGTYVNLSGSTYLKAGVNTVSITHDDGVQFVFSGVSGGSNVGGTTSGSYDSTLHTFTGGKATPTSPYTENFTVNVAAAGLYQFDLGYGELFGEPAKLNFQVNGQVVGVPEPSTLVMGGTAFLAVSGLTWRRNRKGKVALG